MRVNDSALLERQHGQRAAWMKLSPDSVVNYLIYSILIRIYRRYELSRLQLKHRWSSQNLSIEEQGFHEDLPVHRVAQPPRINGWGLKWIG